MDERRSIARRERVKELKGHAVAFLMLGLALVALYTHALYLAVVPLLWMAFRAGKEQGREEAHEDIERASRMAQAVQFPDRRAPDRPGASPPRARRSPRH